MTITATQRPAPLTRTEALALGQIEYGRFVDALRPLTPAEWARPTDCTGWTIRDLSGHVAGMMSSVGTFRRFAGEQLRSSRRAKREGIDPTDAMTAIQIETMAKLTTDELVERMAELVDTATAGRRRMPSWIAKSFRFPQTVNDKTEKWSLDYLFGIILTRDTWLHRVTDLARAVGRPPVLDDQHDARIVADVVAEWLGRHGEPVDLTLTGPAGGHFLQSNGDPQLELDAVDFCRILSGRAEAPHPLLKVEVPF